MCSCVNWQVFDYKFAGETPAVFKRLAYQMFYRNFNTLECLPVASNVKDFDKDPVVYLNGKAVSFIAKYCKEQTVNATRLYEIQKELILISKQYSLNLLYIYLLKLPTPKRCVEP